MIIVASFIGLTLSACVDWGAGGEGGGTGPWADTGAAADGADGTDDGSVQPDPLGDFCSTPAPDPQVSFIEDLVGWQVRCKVQPGQAVFYKRNDVRVTELREGEYLDQTYPGGFACCEGCQAGIRAYAEKCASKHFALN